MRDRLAAFGGLALAGAATGAAVATSRALAARAAGSFYGRTGPRTSALHFGAAYAGSPIIFNRSEMSQTLHTASFEEVRGHLPSDDLYPVRLSGDRAVVAIGAYRHDEITSHGVHGKALMPYGEVIIAALVSRRPTPPVLPLLVPGLMGRSVGAFVLHLPVTHRAARDGGRLGWGYPKFIADMDFEDSLETLRCTLAEGEHEILRHTVYPSGQPSMLSSSTILYSVLEGELLALEVPMSGLSRQRWGSGGGRLELGDHQVADELRPLAISPEPFLTRRVSELHLALTFGHAVGEARPYLGYIGGDRDLGRYTVRYATEAPIDMYAPYGPSAKPSTAIEVGAQSAAIGS